MAYVTGSTGFLGTHVVHQLVDQGWKVIALHRKSSNTVNLDHLDIEQAIGDVLDVASLENTMPENVDAIFHVAADTNLWIKGDDRQNQININGTRNVVNIALKKKAGRMVHTSSMGYFGNHDGPITEDTPSNAMECGINYYRSKYLAEQEVHQGIKQGLDAVIMNPAQVIGRYDYKNCPQIFTNLKKRIVPGVPPGKTTMGHPADYARAHIKAYEKGKTGENYILGGLLVSFEELFSEVGKILGVRTPTFKIPSYILNSSAFMMEKVSLYTNKEPLITPPKAHILTHTLHAVSTKAEKELDFKTISLNEMLTDCYEWMKQEKMI